MIKFAKCDVMVNFNINYRIARPLPSVKIHLAIATLAMHAWWMLSSSPNFLNQSLTPNIDFAIVMLTDTVYIYVYMTSYTVDIASTHDQLAIQLAN